MQLPNYSYVYETEDDDLRREIMRQLCKKDLWFLCRHVLGYGDLETSNDLHLRLCRELDEHPAQYLVLIPRDHFKTSILLAHIIRLLCMDPSHEIGVGSDTAERAQKRTFDLRNMLSNPLLIELFPEIFYVNPQAESDLWTKAEFNINRPARETMRGGFRLSSVTAFGFENMPTGSHFSYVYIDDLENDTNSENQNTIAQLNRNLSAFFPVLPPNAAIHMTGTVWAGDGKQGTGPMTIYQTKPGWKVYKRKVREGNGRYPNLPIFPSRFTEAQLRLKESNVGDPQLWVGQYLLEYQPRTSEMLFPFKTSTFSSFSFAKLPGGGQITRGRHVIDLQDTAIYITVDPSGGSDEAQATSKTDKVGWCVNAVTLDGQWHFLELGEAYLSDDEFIEHLFSLFDAWNPIVIGVEKMMHLQAAMRRAFLLRKKTLPISELKPKGRQKSARIRGLKPLLEGIHLRDHTNQRDFFTAYYTEMQHGDDGIDAAAYQVDIASTPTRELLRQRKLMFKEQQDAALMESLPPSERAEWQVFKDIENNYRKPGTSETQQAWDEIYGGYDNVSPEDFNKMVH